MACIAIIMLVILFVPLYHKISKDGGQRASLTAGKAVIEQVDDHQRPVGQPVYEQSTWYISATALASALLAGFCIFQYRNRLRQMQLSALNSLLIAGCAIGIILTQGMLHKRLDPEVEGVSGIGYFLPWVALVLNMVSNRLIRRDEKLVRSMDRIR